MTSAPGRPRHIGVFCFDGMEELDAVGPWEVFAWWTAHFPQDGFTVTTFSPDGRAVVCEKTLVIQPHHGRDDAPDLDVLVHPGGDACTALRVDDAHLDWLRAQRARVPLLASVCTGSTVFAAAGLLAGRPATSNRHAFDDMARLDPSIDLRRDTQYVDAGDIITSAGISAGIDMALHIVARLAGIDRAREVREGIEYAPQPPA